jgi:hypothetical protein
LTSALRGLVVGAVSCQRPEGRGSAPGAPPDGAAASQAGTAQPELAALREEVDHLKELVPSQSHTMQDVGYHYTNLWFAGQKGNWPLAAFYLNETRSHLKWAVRVRPVRKTRAGDVDLEGIREAFDTSSLREVQQSIESGDPARFRAAYKHALEGCYSCHKASEKPFLRPQVPLEPEQRIIDTDPGANWPK